MATFQGFNIIGVDRNKYPVIMDDQILYDRIYLILKPIDGCADVEAQKVWKHSFRYMVEDWEQRSDFNLYKTTIETYPQLEFVAQDNYEFFICAYGLPLKPLLDTVSLIQALVNFSNQKCIYEIESIKGHRQHIDQFNSGRFSDVIRL